MKITGTYLGNKKVELVHADSGAKIVTSAPKDNQGDGSSFSPTDLCAASLGACAMTLMGIYAERNGIDLTGMEMELQKEMASSPRRIDAILVRITLPQGISEEQKAKLQAVADACPVAKSLHPEVHVKIELI